MNSQRRTTVAERARILRAVSSVEGVTHAQFANLAITPGQAWDVYARHDTSPYSRVRNDLPTSQIVDWFHQLLELIDVRLECYLSLGVPEEPWLMVKTANEKRALGALWSGLQSRDLLIVDRSRTKVLGIQDEEYEYLAHLATVDSFVRAANAPPLRGS